MTRPILRNADARRLFLHRHALCEAGGPADGADLMGVIHRLGFVQVDSIDTVARAHHMILASRRRAYRPKRLKLLAERDRRLFEHWTHDAALIPVEFFPWWRRKFERDAARLEPRWRRWQGEDFLSRFETVLARIRDHGPVTAREVGEGEARSPGGWWEWHPSKAALEYLWRTGSLAVAGRDGFQKVFDLTERVIPGAFDGPVPETEAMVDWACRGALARLGFATSGEMSAFWALATPAEAKDWCAAQADLVEIDVEGADGRLRRSFARPDAFEAAEAAPAPPSRLRVLSPFDPALRDRARAERLFGFHYRIEVFVPKEKRRFGYYVFPLMEGDRLVGRIDMRRRAGALEVDALWPEPGVGFGKGRMARLEAELVRVASFGGCEAVRFLDGWRRGPL